MTFAPKNFTVWAEIPVTDIDKAVAFYSKVTGAGLTIDTSGPNPMAVFQTADPASGVAGHIYPGTPSEEGQGPTIHLAAAGTLEQVIARVWDAGGKVLSDAISIPAGRFVYCQDPFGNSIGFFEEG
ncbi:MAG: VOC family protein [Rhodobacteraceae bacterium]|nr:VOC family protein [Paracoccaceae bacterium]